MNQNLKFLGFDVYGETEAVSGNVISFKPLFHRKKNK
jgi:hypothetical protein